MCECASRCLLIVVNTIFVIVAIICCIVGGFLAWNMQVVYTLLRDYIYPSLNGPASSEQTKTAIENMIRMITPFGLAIFIVGIILLVLCCLGLVGACLNSRCLITVYLAIHGVLLIAELLVVIIYLSKPAIITDNAKQLLTDSVNNYVSINSSDAYSSILTFIMPSLNCCGVLNGSDFDQSTSFQRDYEYNGNKFVLKYPIPCCKLDSSRKPIDNCPVDFTAQNSNINQGCWTVMETELNRYGHIVAYVCLGVIGGQVLLIIAAMVLACKREKSAQY
ncbi:Tetraspanin [Fasciola gigantica]|uniref:Tetraspanin n=1 Tax=Fasciola gigantica TaxID=46835 RepID=A0A504Z2D7_FASGI|nr:Tetraspanin [Fasciola gigantica]